MRKVIVFVLCAVICFSFCGCHLLTSDDSENLEFHENAAYDSEMIDEDDDSFIFTWLSYMEIAVGEALQSEKAYADYMVELFGNMSKLGVTDCFVQVRPFADALYRSQIFPLSSYAKKAQFDPLEVILDVAEKYEIGIHAWINPYRTHGDISFFSSRGIGKEQIIETSSGIYFDPSDVRVQKLIIDGAKELLRNYNIKGIHIDDYFYPPDMNSADEEQFEAYKKKGGKLSLSQWRRENVNTLLKSLYSTVKTYDEDKVFSVSPSGDIDKNINQLYADVRLWCNEEGYCDIILPQIYFGFDNESLPFDETFSLWADMNSSKKVRLIPALALYKVGKEDAYAGKTGKNEWKQNNDILKRQVRLLNERGIYSFGLYSASYINFSETFLSEELNNLKSMV